MHMVVHVTRHAGSEKRRDLSPLPGLDLLDKVDPNKKVNFTAEQLSRLSEIAGN